LLGQVAENVAALTRLSSDAMDLVLRNFRVAGRRDVVRLARQLARTEDKLERVLQELEELHDELARVAVSVTCVPPVDHLDLRGEQAGRRSPVSARRARGPGADRAEPA
jgi:hypothetical protein